jgi:hypothetical protein
MTMKVSKSELLRLLELVIRRLEQVGHDEIKVDTDLYLIIPSDEWHKVGENPTPAIGSLEDDWDSLSRTLSEEGTLAISDFDRVAAILRAISEELVPTK